MPKKSLEMIDELKLQKDSNIIDIGGGQPKVVEHPVVVKISLLVQWKQARFDQKKLATLRSTRGWMIPKMAEHYGVHPTTIKKYLYGNHLWGLKRSTTS